MGVMSFVVALLGNWHRCPLSPVALSSRTFWYISIFIISYTLYHCILFCAPAFSIYVVFLLLPILTSTLPNSHTATKKPKVARVMVIGFKKPAVKG